MDSGGRGEGDRLNRMLEWAVPGDREGVDLLQSLADVATIQPAGTPAASQAARPSGSPPEVAGPAGRCPGPPPAPPVDYEEKPGLVCRYHIQCHDRETVALAEVRMRVPAGHGDGKRTEGRPWTGGLFSITTGGRIVLLTERSRRYTFGTEYKGLFMSCHSA